MAAFPAAMNETGALKRGDKFFYFLWHEITDGCLVVKGRGLVFRYHHMILKDLTLLTVELNR